VGRRPRAWTAAGSPNAAWYLEIFEMFIRTKLSGELQERDALIDGPVSCSQPSRPCSLASRPPHIRATAAAAGWSQAGPFGGAGPSRWMRERMFATSRRAATTASSMSTMCWMRLRYPAAILLAAVPTDLVEAGANLAGRFLSFSLFSCSKVEQ
jgi:hypothetical protein